MINTDLNLRKLKYQFLKDGIVTIENWLDPVYAEELWEHLNTMPNDWWGVSARPDLNDNMQIIKWNDENTKVIENHEQLARDAFEKGLFSYIFRRTYEDHYAECYCAECKFTKDVLSKEVVNFLAFITDYKVTQINELFASYYAGGDFLSPHSDGPNGVLGFVYNLSKNWRPEWGGNLHFQNMQDDRIIDRVNVPRFNTLTMFDIATTQGHTHFVSEVVKNVPEKRFAMAGWWGQSDENKDTLQL